MERRSAATAALHRRAKAQRRERQPETPPLRTEADTQRLLHELEVHQVELEMQNAELLQARSEIETALARYTELYDFAPVGIFSVGRNGLIQEANLTGAAMLDMARSHLVRRRLLDIVAPASRTRVAEFLQAVFAQPGDQACEAVLQRTGAAPFWADLRGSAVVSPSGPREKWCRVAVSDISALKRGEESQRRVVSLALAYQSANREIVRRREAEASLRQSEQTQRELLVEARELQGQLRRLTHRTILVQEEERKRISLKLHDEIAQVLAGISVQLSALQESAASRPQDLPRRIRRTQQMVGESIRIVHHFARDLRPALLDDLGLLPALRSFVKELAARSGLRIRFTAFAGVEQLDSIRRTVLYRVAQEALTNVVRHAAARQATVRIGRCAGGVRLEIRDDGQSFPAERALAARHSGQIGLAGMRERVEMVAGRFEIVSAPGKGTLVRAEIPFAEPAAPGPASELPAG
ncbi:MAG TPA: histidine kinase [Opitutaceae bacterium]|nr:histidine kinase [Opitutaceae bacterium]